MNKYLWLVPASVIGFGLSSAKLQAGSFEDHVSATPGTSAHHEGHVTGPAGAEVDWFISGAGSSSGYADGWGVVGFSGTDSNPSGYDFFPTYGTLYWSIGAYANPGTGNYAYTQVIGGW